MRHGVDKKNFGRNTAHRVAMFRNMVTSLIEHERIVTTLPKAKALKGLADQMITLGKVGTLHARRQALRVLRGSDTVKKLFGELAQRFKDRQGGYTRILKMGHRHGDGSDMAIIEYLEAKLKAKKPTKKKKEKDEHAGHAHP
ncbi:MAG: 50S ribosomal protein L17 [Deltaproteobacteria bacterium]|nr:50S ribosomal protein L17 [Deltaproteobacteria bacterium]